MCWDTPKLITPVKIPSQKINQQTKQKHPEKARACKGMNTDTRTHVRRHTHDARAHTHTHTHTHTHSLAPHAHTHTHTHTLTNAAHTHTHTHTHTHNVQVRTHVTHAHVRAQEPILAKSWNCIHAKKTQCFDMRKFLGMKSHMTASWSTEENASFTCHIPGCTLSVYQSSDFWQAQHALADGDSNDPKGVKGNFSPFVESHTRGICTWLPF